MRSRRSPSNGRFTGSLVPWGACERFTSFAINPASSADPDLWAQLRDALEQSAYLIVLLSSAGARSPWVEREVAYWLGTRDPSSILLVLLEGEVGWDAVAAHLISSASSSVLPVALSDAGVFTSEPLYVDLTNLQSDRERELSNPLFRDRMLTLAAPLHGISKDALGGDDQRELKRFRRYRRLAFIVLSVLTIAALIAAAVAVVQRRRAIENAEVAQGRAFAAMSTSEQDPYRSLALAEIALQQAPVPSSEAVAAFTTASQHLQREPVRRVAAPVPDLGAAVEAVAWSPSNRLVAVGTDTGAVVLVDADDATVVARTQLADDSAVRALSWSHGGSMVAVSTHLGVVAVVDASGRITAQLDHKIPDVVAIEWTAADAAVRFASESAVYTWNTREALSTVTAGVQGVSLPQMAWSRDGATLAGVDGDGGVHVLLDGQRPLPTPPSFAPAIAATALAWSPQGWVAFAYTDGSITIWDSVAGVAVLHLASAAPPGTRSMSWSADGRYLAISGTDLRIWSLDRGAMLGDPIGLSRSTSQLALYDRDTSVVQFSGTDRVAVGAADGSLTLLELVSPVQPTGLGQGAGLAVIQTSPDGTATAWVTADGQIDLRDLRTGATTFVPDAHDVTAVAWNGPGDRLGWGTSAGDVFVASVPSDHIAPQQVGTVSGKIDSLQFTSHDADIGVVDERGTATRLSLGGGSSRPSVQLADAHPVSASWKDDGTQLAVIDSKGEAQTWMVDGGSQGTTAPAPSGQAWTAISFVGTTGTVALGMTNGDMALWDPARGGIPVRRSSGAAGHSRITSIAVPTTGPFIATVDSDFTTQLWDASTLMPLGEPLRSLADVAPTGSIVWSADGQRLFQVVGAAVLEWKPYTPSDACDLLRRTLDRQSWDEIARLGDSGLCDPAADDLSIPLIPAAAGSH